MSDFFWWGRDRGGPKARKSDDGEKEGSRRWSFAIQRLQLWSTVEWRRWQNGGAWSNLQAMPRDWSRFHMKPPSSMLPSPHWRSSEDDRQRSGLPSLRKRGGWKERQRKQSVGMRYFGYLFIFIFLKLLYKWCHNNGHVVLVFFNYD